MPYSQSVDFIDADEEDYLYVQDSEIPNSGKGLFTAIKIYKNEMISLFKGELLSNEEADSRAIAGNDQYFISMPDGSILDSKSVDCFAKYANDANGSATSRKNNAIIVINENKEVCLKATRNIGPEQEIYCSYGKAY